MKQQAAQIKQLLKLLNNSNSLNIGTNLSTNHVTNNANRPESSKDGTNNPSDETSDNNTNDTGGEYESLWEFTERTLTLADDVEDDTTEVEEDEDVTGDKEELYENTGVFAQSFSVSTLGKNKSFTLLVTCLLASCIFLQNISM